MKSISLQKEHILTSKILMSTFLSLAMLLTSHVCHAETRKAVLFIRNTNENELKGQFCKTSNCKDIATIKTDTREFANGNTFVRFIDSTSQNNITILSPEVLNSNQFMELLIKIRIAKTDYAQSIQLYIPNNLMSIQVVDEFGKKMISEDLTRNLLASAGLQKINHKNLQVMQFKKSGSSEKTIVVDQGLNSELAKEIAKNLDLKAYSIEQAIEIASTEKLKVIFISSLSGEHNKSFLHSLNAIHQFKQMGSQITLVSPYLPYARSDKKDQYGVAITGRLAADMIETSGTDAVSFVRAHAPQSEGFFKIPTIQTMGRKTINAFLANLNVEQIISPDAGFQKDATLYADDLKVPVSVVNKQRNLQTGESKLHGISGPKVKGKIVAIIDDETASGGTLGKVAEFLKKLGAAKVVAVVTHLSGNADQALNSVAIDSLAVTDTFKITKQHSKLSVLSVAKEISDDLKKVLKPNISCQKVYSGSF